MKIPLKTPSEIKKMSQGGKYLAEALEKVVQKAKPGVTLKQLDLLAEKEIKKHGLPSFKMVENYHWATCLNVNEGVVHGVPNDYPLKKGDLLSVDMGLHHQGFHTDMATTVSVKGQKADKEFLEAGRLALEKAIKAARSGNRVGHISQQIEETIKSAGHFPVKSLTGHGVGRKLHEPPQIPCFLKENIKDTPKLRPGMVLAIEVIYSQGDTQMVLKDDGWTLVTANGKPAALFERTVAIKTGGPLILTSMGPIQA
jgi:methionyl aminopeptidase